MPGRDGSHLDQLQNLRPETQQPQRIRDRRTRFSHALRRLLLRHAVLADELLIALRFFNRVEIGAL